MLYEINHDVKRSLYCGPGAIAIVTGQPASAVYAVVQADRGRTVKGMMNGELFRALAHFGYKCREVFSYYAQPFPRGPKPTLVGWARKNRELFADVPVIVEYAGHYGVLMGRSFMDNQTKAKVAISEATHARGRVVRVWAVTPTGMPAKPIPAKPVKAIDAATRRRARARVEAKRLAELHGIVIEKENHGSGNLWWVTHPDLTDTGRDPCEGDHIGYDWVEILDKVESYVKALAPVSTD